jgi:hypothetical protein
MTLEFLLGSVYVITVLYVLNTRNEQRRESSAWNTVLFTGDGVRNGVGVREWSFSPRLLCQNPMACLFSIYLDVHRTVYVDDGKTVRAVSALTTVVEANVIWRSPCRAPLTASPLPTS